MQERAGDRSAARLRYPLRRHRRSRDGGVRGRALRRGDHRRRPQRARQRRLPRPGRAEDARPRAAPRPRRRGRHRGALPGLPVLGLLYVVSLLRPEIIRELELPRHGLDILPLDGTFTPLRPGDGPKGRRGNRAPAPATTCGGSTTTAGRSASSAAGRRRDAEAYEEYGQLMVEMARFIKPILGDHAAGPDLARPAPAAARSAACSALPAAARAPAGGLRPADDDVARPTSSTSGSRPTRSRRR